MMSQLYVAACVENVLFLGVVFSSRKSLIVGCGPTPASSQQFQRNENTCCMLQSLPGLRSRDFSGRIRLFRVGSDFFGSDQTILGRIRLFRVGSDFFGSDQTFLGRIRLFRVGSDFFGSIPAPTAISLNEIPCKFVLV